MTGPRILWGFEALTPQRGRYTDVLLNCSLRAYEGPGKCLVRVFEVPTRKAKVHVKQWTIQSGFLIFQIAVVKLSGRGAVLGKGKEESAGNGGILRTLHDMLPYAPRESAVKICDISLFM